MSKRSKADLAAQSIVDAIDETVSGLSLEEYAEVCDQVADDIDIRKVTIKDEQGG